MRKDAGKNRRVRLIQRFVRTYLSSSSSCLPIGNPFPIIPPMSIRSAGFAAISTLVLSTLLHAFTHAFGAMLVPLYLLIWHDLKLPGVQSATLIVTVYGMVYAILSYPAGVLADRISRKTMLGAGLLLNAVVIVLMGLTRSYEMLLV